MFTQIRDFAFQLKTMMASVFRDKLVMERCRARVYRQQLHDVVDKWRNVGARDEELYLWLDRAAVLHARAVEMLRGADGLTVLAHSSAHIHVDGIQKRVNCVSNASSATGSMY